MPTPTPLKSGGVVPTPTPTPKVAAAWARYGATPAAAISTGDAHATCGVCAPALNVPGGEVDVPAAAVPGVDVDVRALAVPGGEVDVPAAAVPGVEVDVRALAVPGGEVPVPVAAVVGGEWRGGRPPLGVLIVLVPRAVIAEAIDCIAAVAVDVAVAVEASWVL